MRSLGQILGSAARTNILRILWHQSRPVGLRHVARLAGVQPRSADLALQALVREGRVTCRRSPGRNFYRLNRRHPEATILDAVFEAADRARNAAGLGRLNEWAKSILPFIEDSGAMRERTRSRNR